MKKIFRLSIITIVVVAVLFLLYNLIVIFGIGGVFSPRPNEKHMKVFFKNDKIELQSVADYLSNSEYVNVYISHLEQSGFMYAQKANANIGSDVAIKDETIVNHINMLREKGYNTIGKDKNSVYFQKWSNLDGGRGIVYSMSSEEPTLQFLTKLASLSEPNWYYYEEDFNEWKRINQSQHLE